MDSVIQKHRVFIRSAHLGWEKDVKLIDQSINCLPSHAQGWFWTDKALTNNCSRPDFWYAATASKAHADVESKHQMCSRSAPKHVIACRLNGGFLRLWKPELEYVIAHQMLQPCKGKRAAQTVCEWDVQMLTSHQHKLEHTWACCRAFTAHP